MGMNNRYPFPENDIPEHWKEREYSRQRRLSLIINPVQRHWSKGGHTYNTKNGTM